MTQLHDEIFRLEFKVEQDDKALRDLRQQVIQAFQLEQVLWTSLGSGCDITITFHVTDVETGSDLAGVLVELKDSGGTVVASGTTDSDGLVTLHASSADHYTATLSLTNYTTQDYDLGSFDCGDDETEEDTLRRAVCAASHTLNMVVKDCGGNLRTGVSWSVTGPGATTPSSGSTNGSGQLSFSWTHRGTYTITVGSSTISIDLESCVNSLVTSCDSAPAFVARVVVTGCAASARSGLTATFTYGAYSTTATTDGSGAAQVCIPYTAGTSLTMSVPASGLYQAGSVSVASGSIATCTTVARSISLSPVSGYSCIRDACCSAADQSGPPYAAITYPSTTYLTDPFGTITLTRFTGHGAVMYAGGAVRSAWRYGVYDSDFASCRAQEGPHDVNLLFVVGCPTGGGWSLSIYGDQCYDPNSDMCGSVFQPVGGSCAGPLLIPSVAGDPSCQATTSNINYSFFGLTSDSTTMDTIPHCPGGPLAGSFVLGLVLGSCPRLGLTPFIYSNSAYTTTSVTFTWSE